MHGMRRSDNDQRDISNATKLYRTFQTDFDNQRSVKWTNAGKTLLFYYSASYEIWNSPNCVWNMLDVYGTSRGETNI